MRSVAEVTKDIEDFCEYNHIAIVAEDDTDEVIASFFETHCGLDGDEPPTICPGCGKPTKRGPDIERVAKLVNF